MAAVATKKKDPPHVMISYWDCQELASYVYDYLKKKLKQPVWIDTIDLKGSSITDG
jgi:hypothetical protein